MSKTKKTLTDHEAEISSWFCGVTRDPNCMELVKTRVKEWPKWFYIIHKPDKPVPSRGDADVDAESGLHIHFVIYTRTAKSIKQIADFLGLPSNFVEDCKHKREYIRYMTHIDHKDKIQYSPSDIVTNRPSTVQIAVTDNSDDDPRRLYNDLKKLRSGRLSVSDFIDLHYVQICEMPCYQQLRIFGMLEENAGADYLTSAPGNGLTGVNNNIK